MAAQLSPFPFPSVSSRQWDLKELTPEGLVLSEPKPVERESLGPKDVLVKIQSVSLNYRDILIINQGGASFGKLSKIKNKNKLPISRQFNMNYDGRRILTNCVFFFLK